MENTVCIELLRRKNACPGPEIFYWKNHQHYEVDFVVKKKASKSGSSSRSDRTSAGSRHGKEK